MKLFKNKESLPYDKLDRIFKIGQNIILQENYYLAEPPRFNINGLYNKDGQQLTLDEVLEIVQGLFNKEKNLIDKYNITEDTFNTICNTLSVYFENMGKWAKENASIYIRVRAMENKIINIVKENVYFKEGVNYDE